MIYCLVNLFCHSGIRQTGGDSGVELAHPGLPSPTFPSRATTRPPVFFTGEGNHSASSMESQDPTPHPALWLLAPGSRKACPELAEASSCSPAPLPRKLVSGADSGELTAFPEAVAYAPSGLAASSGIAGTCHLPGRCVRRAQTLL